MAIQQSTLGGGCFWCLESAFLQLKGVDAVVSGYAGGHSSNPSYEEVCSGGSGHAEVVQIGFDDAIIDFRSLLTVFFAIHDPTTLNRQGADIGSQYRSIILYHNDEQRQQAQQMVEELNQQQIWDNPIVTEISPLKDFYPAESYHQNFYQLNPSNRYCNIVIPPKLEKLKKHFASLLRK